MIDKFEVFILESRFTYFGNYNTVPIKNRDKNFQLMSSMAKPVKKAEFLKNVELNQDLGANDLNHPDIRFFKSIWDGKDVYYFTDKGMENIFINNDSISL